MLNKQFGSNLLALQPLRQVIFTLLICEECCHNREVNIRLSNIMAAPTTRVLWERNWLVMAFSLREMYYRDLREDLVQKRVA